MKAIKNWKRKLSSVLAMALCVCSFPACGGVGGGGGSSSSSEDTTVQINDDDYNVYAYYFPNSGTQNIEKPWDPVVDCEWGLVQRAIPRFEGHAQPKVPLWGYENHSDPEVMTNVIETASSYGVDAFIFDWYWYREIRLGGKGNGTYLEKELENGFLNAQNDDMLDFAICWCNHDAAGNKGIYETPEEFEIMTDYIIENYFTNPNYLKVDGKMYFGVWDMAAFVEMYTNEYGQTDMVLAKEALDRFDKKVQDRGMGGIYISAMEYNLMNADGTTAWDDIFPPVGWSNAKYLGVDDVTDYKLTPTANDFIRYDLDSKGGVYEYSGWANNQVQEVWSMKEAYNEIGVNYIPCLLMGYDVTPRVGPYNDWDVTIGVYPQSPVYYNNNPTAVGNYATELRKVLDENKQNTIYVYAWNEWAEGSYLEPDTQYGYGYLRMLQSVFGS